MIALQNHGVCSAPERFVVDNTIRQQPGFTGANLEHSSGYEHGERKIHIGRDGNHGIIFTNP